MKHLNLLAILLMVLASCTNEEYVGNPELVSANGETPISFGFDVPAMTRASGADAATALGNSFAVYATKTVGETTSNVFALNEYSNSSNNPYWVWYTASTAGKTTSNTNNWEYVGAAGTHGTVTTTADQTIKYWDYSAVNYTFVAYKATVGTPTISNLTNTGFTVSATTAQLAGLYIADKVVLTAKDNSPAANPNTTIASKIGDVVQLTFRAAGAKVRLGIYETIPGYDISAVTFHYNGTTSTSNAYLDGKFVGSSDAQSFTVTYDGTNNRAKVSAPEGANTTYRDFGTFSVSTSALMGKSSTAPTWAGGSADYVSVMPNITNLGPMTLSVDYTLYNSVTKEVINVTGAKAVVPVNYMTWKANTAYTYLFKISDNTNGYTGTSTNPAGLYPVTFDAVTIASDENAEGSITTVSTPAITTYQAGSVSASGITYAKSAQPIYVTVNTNGTLAELTTTNTKLYTVAEGTTEAELQLAAVTKTAATGLSVVASNITVGSTSFVADKAVTFTPTTANTYAIEYTDDSSVKHYKVIVVE